MKKKFFALLTIGFLLTGNDSFAQITNSIGLNMIKVEGGTFTMGRNTDSHEKPEHQVTVDGFYIGETEITYMQYNRIMNNDTTSNEYSNNPKRSLSWYQAVELCNKLSEYEGLKPFYTIDKTRKDPNNLLSHDDLKYLVTYNWDADGYRLPFEAEWEYAARGGNKSKGYIYSGGNDPSLVGLSDTHGNLTLEVSSLLPNELGIYDMSGNVGEFCNDWLGDLKPEPAVNPRGATSGIVRVARGGNYYYDIEWMRPSFRSASQPCVKENSIGMRVVCPLNAKIKQGKVEFSSSSVWLYYNRAKLYKKIKDYDNVLKNYLFANQIYDQYVGTIDENKGSLTSNIAVCYLDMGNYPKAIETFLNALAIFEKVFGKGHVYIATTFNNIALTYENMGDYPNAISYYRKAIEMEESLKGKSSTDLVTTYESLATLYSNLEKYSEAIECFSRILEIKEANKESTLVSKINIGALYLNMEETQKAFDMFQQLLEPVKKEFGPQSKNYALLITNLGQVYENLSEFSKALSLYQEVLPIYQKEYGAESSQTAVVYNNIGQVYNSMGVLDKSIEFSQKALSLREKADGDISENTAQSRYNLGNLYINKKEYPKALEHLNQSLAIYQKLKGENHKMVAYAYNGIGVAHTRMEQYDKALENLNKSLAIREHLFGKESKMVSSVLNNLANIYEEHFKDTKKALEFYLRALSINEKSWGVDVTTNYVNIANIYYKTGDYPKAIEYLNKTIAAYEKIRSGNIPDVNKIAYFSAILDVYQFLIRVYVLAGQIDKAYEIRELSSAKYFLEKMGEKAGPSQPKAFDINVYSNTIANQSAVVSFSNTNWNNIVILVTTKGYYGGVEVSKKDFVERVKSKINSIPNYTETDNANKRGFKVVPGVYDDRGKSSGINTSEYNDDFNNIINYYRSLLQNPSTSGLNHTDFVVIGKELYNLFVEPLKTLIGEKKELLICPDGLLNLIPFEAFISDKSRYLVEDYDISYTQSLSVLSQLGQRSYAPKKNPLLAFGGAIYHDDKVSYTPTSVTVNEFDLKSSILKGSNSELISKFNLQWDNLPGTLEEVKSIKKNTGKATVVTGKKVTEDNLKLMSQKGELKNYSAIHFATHGMVVPEFPELSSIVLSQIKDDKNLEDGYLTMKEILNLNLECDYVNLSACETGLGKVIVGEGIVGLTQSFLLSGANGISVSLWKIADESTAQFMSGMYGKSTQENMPYHKSLTAMKRQFIKEGKYSSAFYWAPFVYYGKQ